MMQKVYLMHKTSTNKEVKFINKLISSVLETYQMQKMEGQRLTTDEVYDFENIQYKSNFDILEYLIYRPIMYFIEMERGIYEDNRYDIHKQYKYIFSFPFIDDKIEFKSHSDDYAIVLLLKKLKISNNYKLIETLCNHMNDKVVQYFDKSKSDKNYEKCFNILHQCLIELYKRPYFPIIGFDKTFVKHIAFKSFGMLFFKKMVFGLFLTKFMNE